MEHAGGPDPAESRCGCAGRLVSSRAPDVSEAFGSRSRTTTAAFEPGATLTRGHAPGGTLKVVYDKPGKEVYFDYPVEPERYQALITTLRRIKFDRLDDQPDVPFFGVDLWLVERASGSYYHDVVLSPESARGFYRELILALQQHLKEALRTITP